MSDEASPQTQSEAEADPAPITPGEIGQSALQEPDPEGEESPFLSDGMEDEGEWWNEFDESAESESDSEESAAEGEPASKADAPSSDEKQQGAEQGQEQDAQAQGQEQEPKADKDPLHTVKIDGEDKQVPLSELIDGYERSKASYKRFEEAAKLRKQHEAQLEQIKDNPTLLFRLAAHFGHDPQQLAEQYLLDEVITPSKLPEEARKRLEEERKKREEIEERERQRQQQQAQEARQRQQREFQEKTLPAIQSSMQEQGVPVNDATMRHVLHEMDKALQNQVQLSPKEAVELVAEHWHGSFKERLSSMDVKKLLDELGPEKAKAIREHFAAEVRRPQSKTKPKATGNESGGRKDTSRPLSLKEVQRNAARRMGVR